MVLFDHILVDVIAVFDVFTSVTNMDVGTVYFWRATDTASEFVPIAKHLLHFVNLRGSSLS